jgi:Domain of unknown function (DUF4411)
MYVFDTSPLSALFGNYYRNRFPTLWARFDSLVDKGGIVSTREVLHEINDSSIEAMRRWAEDNQNLFSTPTAEEGKVVASIFAQKHFQQNIEQQKLLKGGRNADPFVIARAAVEGKTIVTMEAFKPNSARIPNICKHFNVPCMTLEEFMEAEGWKF